MEQNLFGKSNVLITGSAGLVGFHLLQTLCKHGANVKAMVRTAESKRLLEETCIARNVPLGSLEWFVGDITNIHDVLQAVEDVDYIFHCAGFVSFHWKEYEKLYAINVLGTQNIVNAALEHSCCKLCHVSSVAALGKAPLGKAIDESCDYSNTNLRSPYNYTKYLAEMEVWRGVAEGLNAVIVNPSVIVGAGIHWDVSSAALFSQVAKGMKYYTPGITGYVSVDDVVRCMILLMQHPVSGERFVLSAENLDYKTVFSAIAHSLELKPPHMQVKKWQIYIAACILSIKGIFTNTTPKITKHTATTAFATSHYSSQKIQELCNYEFQSVVEKIREVGHAYLHQHDRN